MNVAIIENDTVVNVIVCDTLELAQELTGASQVLDADLNSAYMNYTLVDGVWTPPVIEE